MIESDIYTCKGALCSRRATVCYHHPVLGPINVCDQCKAELSRKSYVALAISVVVAIALGFIAVLYIPWLFTPGG